jgi:putative PIN family toxin of toxin-antitoxin system
VVIDPNVWIAALINPYGAPARVVEAVLAGQVLAVASQRLLEELTEVLLRPKFRRWVSITDAVGFVEALGGHVQLRADPAEVSGWVRDPDDAYLVALAVAADAVIVTEDADLLAAELAPRAITVHELLLDVLGQ